MNINNEEILKNYKITLKKDLPLFKKGTEVKYRLLAVISHQLRIAFYCQKNKGDLIYNICTTDEPLIMDEWLEFKPLKEIDFISYLFEKVNILHDEFIENFGKYPKYLLLDDKSFRELDKNIPNRTLMAGGLHIIEIVNMNGKLEVLQIKNWIGERIELL